MNEQTPKKTAGMRSFWLTASFCGAILLGGTDLRYGTGLFGYLLFMIATGILAVIFSSEKGFFSTLIAAGSIVIFLTLGGMDIAFAAQVLPILLPAIAIFLLIRGKNTKTTTVLVTAIVWLLSLLMVYFVERAVQGHSLVPKTIFAELGERFAQGKASVAAATAELMEALPESTKLLYEKQSGKTMAELIAMVPEIVDVLANTIKLVAPGLILSLALTLSYLSVVSFSVSARASGRDILLPEPRWWLVPTKVTVIVFMIAMMLGLLASFFGSGFMAGIYMVSLNLVLILLPCVMACGVRGYLMRLRHPALKKRALLSLIPVVVLLLMLPPMGLLWIVLSLAFMGAKDVLAMYAIAEQDEQKQKKE